MKASLLDNIHTFLLVKISMFCWVVQSASSSVPCGMFFFSPVLTAPNPNFPRAPSHVTEKCLLPSIDRWQAEDQFQTALRAHLQNMDRLIDLQDSRLLALEQEFEMELSTLQKVCVCILRLTFLTISSNPISIGTAQCSGPGLRCSGTPF